jgi:hypothetical protein
MTIPTEPISANRLYEALGRLVVQFSWLEDNLHDAFAVALHPSDVRFTNVLTAGLQFRTLVEKLGTLLRDHPERRVSPEDLQDFCAHLLTLNEQRNSTIHSVYGRTRTGEQKAYRRSARMKAGFSLNVRDVAVSDIDELCAHVEEAEKKLWEVVP